MSRPNSLLERELIPRVKQYLEENVHKTYVDVEEMTTTLMTRYTDYSRLKQAPFRHLVETAYKSVLHNYGIESNPGSENDEEIGSDLEVMDDATNHMSNALNSLYMKKKPATAASSSDPAISIDISSDEDESGGNKQAPKNPIDSSKVTVTKVSANGSKVPATSEELATLINSRPGPASQKRRRLEQLEDNVKTSSTKEKPSSTALATQRPKKFKKEVYAKRSTVKFSDVGGVTKALEEICELALHIKHPNIYRAIGTAPPRGILLHGPPGSGKTLLAHAIAGELDVFLIEVAATELIAGVSGESEERIREVFEQAASFAPCVLFIDEIDAVSSNRQNAQKDMERRIVAQLLQSFDNLSKMEYGDQVLVIGATNRPDSLDPALRRVGRFDHEICLGIPDRKAREEILTIITDKINIVCEIELNELAALTPGFVGADLYSLVARAASTTVKRFLHEKELEFAAKEAAIKKPLTIEPIVSLDDDLLMEVDSTAEAAKTEEKTNVEEEPKISEEEEKEPLKEDTPMEPVEDLKTDEAKEEEKIKESIHEYIKPELTLETMLKFIHNENIISPAEVQNLTIKQEDFFEALKNIQPSAKREGFITVPDVVWDDIGSLQDIRKELKLSILAPVKFPDLMEKLGIKSPSGVLLWGPPGCGKTLLAKAVANEAGINFISVKGPELLNMYVGESERAVRLCFQRARNSAPCVIFFDEFDALCPKRSDSGEGSGTQRVVNQLLTEMDGIQERKGVFLMAASNRPDIIDPAILRPGRLDKIIYVGLPAKDDRTDILRALTKNGTKPELAENVNLEEIATLTERFTGADLAGLVREASYKVVEKAFEGEMTDIKAHKEDFTSSFLKMKPSVSEQDIIYYEKLKAKYAS